MRIPKMTSATTALSIALLVALPAVALAEGYKQPPAQDGPDGFCTTPPYGNYDDSEALAQSLVEQIIGKYPDFPQSYPSGAEIDGMVTIAASETGINDPDLLNWIADEARRHMPGGSCYDGPEPGTGPEYGEDDPYNDEAPPPEAFRYVFKMAVEPAGLSQDYDETLNATLLGILNLPRSWEIDPEDVTGIDIDIDLAGARLKDRFGNRVTVDDVAGADEALVKAKLLPVDFWDEDGYGEVEPTFKARKVVIVDPGLKYARKACAAHRRAKASKRARAASRLKRACRGSR